MKVRRRGGRELLTAAACTPGGAVQRPSREIWRSLDAADFSQPACTFGDQLEEGIEASAWRLCVVYARACLPKIGIA